MIEPRLVRRTEKDPRGAVSPRRYLSLPESSVTVGACFRGAGYGDPQSLAFPISHVGQRMGCAGLQPAQACDLSLIVNHSHSLQQRPDLKDELWE